MRLIDADSLFESIRDYTFDTTSIEMRRAEYLVKSHICELIEKHPTAYNVDKVVEQLRRKLKVCPESCGLKDCVDCVLERAVDIVKSELKPESE